MPATEIIKSACGQIMAALKEGRFTRKELEFLLKLFRGMVESTEKVIMRIGEKAEPPAGK